MTDEITIGSPRTREEAIHAGFGGFNKANHVPITLPENEMATVTVKQGNHLVTFCFIPNECIDIAVHKEEPALEDINANIVPHTALAFEVDGPVVKTTTSTTDITAILLPK